MKIAMVWFWDKASQTFPNWRDGLRAAIEEIEKKHQVVWIMDKNLPDPSTKWDAILFWDDSNSKFFDELHRYDCPKGLFLTTDPQNFENLRKLDVVYCESAPVYNAVRQQGIRAIKAFGTDTDFYCPDETYSTEKNIPYFYPATFSPWKRQADIAHLGEDLTCIGTVQPDGALELQECQKNGVNIKIGYFPPGVIRSHYRRAQHVIIPAVHGSERTVLEAMACDILPEVTNPANVRALSFLSEYKLSEAKTPRQFVLRNYSHIKYAKDIMRGIKND